MTHYPSPQPLISVVLPTFNRAPLIEAAIRNVLAQDYANLELIVVNDGSADETAVVLERVARELNDPRLRVLTKRNGGLPRALNTGFEAARGEYLTWTSDDNAYRSGALSALARELELDPEIGLVFADYQLINSDGTPGAVVETGPVEELRSKNVVGACFMYRRTLADKVGAYNPDLELAEDYDYWVRAAAITKLAHLPRTLYDYGNPADSLTYRNPIGVILAGGRIVSRQGSQDALRDYKVTLARRYKEHGMLFKSLGTALSIISEWPLSAAGYWAVLRAFMPLALLRLTRRLRGVDGKDISPS